MNEWELSELIGDLPDDMITEAYAPHRKHQIIYILSAAAACFVAVIAAVIYPKLRMQTPETVSEPETIPAVYTETTVFSETASYSETQLSSVDETVTERSASSVSVTVTYSSDSAEILPELTTSVSETMLSALTETTVFRTTNTTTAKTASETALLTMVETVSKTVTQTKKTTAVLTESSLITSETVHSETTVPEGAKPKEVTFPIWKGRIEHPESVPVDPKPMISGRFNLCPVDADDYLRVRFGIPAEYDLTQHQCLLVTLDAFMYQDAAIVSGEWSNDCLHLKIACLPDTHHDKSVIHFALPIPDNMTIEPNQCSAEYVAMTDQTEYQALLTESLTIEINEEE